MAALGPFERRPRLAVAVSGGADSMALTRLAARWAAARGGALIALTVDHGLRPESAAEAAQVNHWLAALDIPHRVLTWQGAKPQTGLQAAARAARYRLMLDYCAGAGLLHLLLAHHRDDQVETFVQRSKRCSAKEAAAMTPVTVAPQTRLLRPLLGIPKVRLEATLTALRQDWIEDASNRNTAFERVRVRAALAIMGQNDGLASAETQSAARRDAGERQVTSLLARAVQLSPAGYARVETSLLMDAPQPVSLRALGCVLRTVGGAIYLPRAEQLRRIWTELADGLADRRSLGGCLLSPGRGHLAVYREPAAMAEPVPAGAGDTVFWDGRFLLRLGGQGRARVGALSGPGWRQVKADCGYAPWPATATVALPALFDEQGPAEIPHLRWRRTGCGGPNIVDFAFAPASPLTGGLVWQGAGTMC